ncbi:hypothetical protein PQX77_020249 [Marasmius sp. AFHP31]|nr:hypothetical protein PQX77_020249 [Marasmius sp. AFHP31]
MNGVSNGRAENRVFISDARVVPTDTVGVASEEGWTDGRSGQFGEPQEPHCPGRIIKATFQDALRGELQFDRDLTYHEVYDDAPNPCLKLNGPGAIGLPLNDIQIDAIKRFCVADPAAGENVCFFPGEQIEIRNPTWTSWFQDVVVAHLNKALGTSAEPLLIGLRIRGPQTTDTASILQQRVTAFHLWRQALNADPAQLSHTSIPTRPEATTPSIYLYILKRNYRTVAGLCRNQLRGSDQWLMSLMEPLARMFHFDVHLARAKYTRTGEAYAPTKRSRMAERFGRGSDASSLDSFDDDDDDESLNLDKLEMEDDVPSIKFRGVYTLDGEKVRIVGGEIERITGDELEDEEQKKFVINGTLYDGKPSDKGWKRRDSEVILLLRLGLQMLTIHCPIANKLAW